MKLPRRIVPIGLTLLFPFAASAADVLEEIVVTATRTEKLFKSAPFSVSVVTHDQLMRQTGDQLADYLADVPGIFTYDAGQAGFKRLRIRGEEARRMAFLIDGQEFLDHREVGVPLLISPASIERIEVVRGPASVLYGPKAMGGVVNIITEKHIGKPFAATVSGDLNSATDGQHYAASLAGHRNGLTWGLSFAANEQRDRDTPEGEIENTSYESDSLSANLRKQVGTHVFSIGYEDFDADAEVHVEPEVRFTPPFLDFAIDTPQRDRRKLRFGYEASVSGPALQRVKADGYRQVSDRRFDTFLTLALGPGAVMDTTILTDSRLVSDGINGQLDFAIGNHWLIAGVQAVKDEVDQSRHREAAMNSVTTGITDNIDEAYIGSTALYVQDDWQATDRLSLILGGRYYDVHGKLEASNRSDHRPVFDDTHFVGSAAVVYSLNEATTLRANVTQGYIFPSLLNLAVGAYAGSRFVNPDPGLAPETSNNVEAGLRYSTGRWALDTSIFLSRAHDYIDHVFCTETDACLTPADKIYKNVGEAHSWGFELSGAWHLARWEPYLNLTWMKRRRNEGSVDTYDSGIPELSGRAGLRGESLGNLSLDIYARFESEAKETVPEAGGPTTEVNDGWITLNLDVNLAWRERYRITASFRNITDKKYSSATENLLAPSRHLQVGLTATF